MSDLVGIPRILSIQSHVVSGCVGNSAAVFPLQLLGFQVDSINSVQFSNHTGYPNVKGSVLSGPDLNSLVEGLQSNMLLSHDYLLTGYIGSESFLESILQLLDKAVASNASLKYVCDPVLGDGGVCYVPKDLVQIYKEKVIPRAYMITPNQFEAELLTGISITDEDSLVRALIQLYNNGPKVVAITSADIKDFPGRLCCYILSSSGNEINESKEAAKSRNVLISKISVAKVEGCHFTGTGDLTTALLLAWAHLLTSDAGVADAAVEYTPVHAYGEAFLRTLSTVQAVLTKAHSRFTHFQSQHEDTQSDATAADTTGDDPINSALYRAKKCSWIELPLVRCKEVIECPPIGDSGLTVTTWAVEIPSHEGG